MSERKVLNKYYPPDFDPSKIPRAKCNKNRQFTVRLMAPCNMKCLTCGEYIAKAKKFNARKEDVENLSYLGIRIYRFYIKCPGCLAEISFRTDPESTDYIIEAGAHRNFQALKLAEEQAAREDREAIEEIESNPMLLLENRTQQSQHEMEVLESLEDLRELNERNADVNLDLITENYEKERKLTREQKDDAEKSAALKALGYEEVEGKLVKRVLAESSDIFTKRLKSDLEAPIVKQNRNIANCSLKSKLFGLVRISNKITRSNADEKPGPPEIKSFPVSSLKGHHSQDCSDLTTKTGESKVTSSSSRNKVPSSLTLVSCYDDTSGSDSDG